MAIDVNHSRISVARQCDLLGLSRSSWYYRARRDETAAHEDEQLMRLIDRQYTLTPFYGVVSMRDHLRQMGRTINVKRVRRLMRLMGLEAIYPKPRTSVNSPENKVFAYLLRGVRIARTDQVWSTDITYIPMRRGHAYLVAVMDWFSRYVLSWELSATMDVTFCISALRQALSLGTPEIFNSDQGSQFTSSSFTRVLLDAGIAISMDGRGRALDNVFIERLWRSVKHEEVYLRDYQTPREAALGLERYFAFYNFGRPHQALSGRTPAQVHGVAPTRRQAMLARQMTTLEVESALGGAASALALRAHSEAAPPAGSIHLISG